MSLYDRIMTVTDGDTATLKASYAAQGAARIVAEIGHPGLAAAAAVGGALFAAVDTVMHVPKAAPGTYAGFRTG
ncbi:hypothetical protein ACIOC1_34155 [Streptomyces sp. NPDC088197]|uniref:hypothetical protein n=1 Tax=unclassified Streptomyces TaxID=2593676 RepID=UPI0036E2C9B1